MKPNQKTQIYVLLVLFLSQLSIYYSKQGWDYTKGGADWTGSCKDSFQAPIEVGLPFFYKEMNFSFHYSNMMTEYTFYNDGNNLILEGDFGYMKYNNKTYFSSEVLFFSPSLHTFSNRHFPLELQLIHHDDNGKKLSISILFKFSKSDYSLLLGNLGFDKSELLHQQAFKPKTFKEEINFSKYIQDNKDFLMYEGKDAKPPCKTETTYFLLTDILKISKKQLDNFPLLIRNNNRIIQKRLDRKIFSSFKPEDMEKKEQLIQEKVAKIKKMKEEERNIKKIEEEKRMAAMAKNKKTKNKTKSQKTNVTVDISEILNNTLFNMTGLNQTSDKYKAIQKEINRIINKNNRNTTNSTSCKKEDLNIPLETVKQKAKSIDEYIKSNYPKFIKNFDVDKNETLTIDRDLPLSKPEMIRKSLDEKYKVWKRLYEQTTNPSSKVDAKSFIQMKSLEMEFKRNGYEPYLNERKVTKDDLFLSFVQLTQLDPGMFPETSYQEYKKRVGNEKLDKILHETDNPDELMDSFVEEIEKNSDTLNKAEKKLKIEQDELHKMKLRKIKDMKSLITDELQKKKQKKEEGKTYTIKMRKMKSSESVVKPVKSNKNSIINDLVKEKFNEDEKDDDIDDDNSDQKKNKKTVNDLNGSKPKKPLKVITDDEENKADMEKIKARYLKQTKIKNNIQNEKSSNISTKEINKLSKSSQVNSNENDDESEENSEENPFKKHMNKMKEKERVMSKGEDPFAAVFDDLETNKQFPVEEAKKLITKSKILSKKINEINDESVTSEVESTTKNKKKNCKIKKSISKKNKNYLPDQPGKSEEQKVSEKPESTPVINKKLASPSKQVINKSVEVTQTKEDVDKKVSKKLEPIVTESPKSVKIENILKPKIEKDPIKPIVVNENKKGPLQPIITQAAKKVSKQLEPIVTESPKNIKIENILKPKIVKNAIKPEITNENKKSPLQPIITHAPEGSNLQPVMENIDAEKPQLSVVTNGEIKTPRVPLQPIITQAPEESHLQPIINKIPDLKPKLSVIPTREIKPSRVPLQPLIIAAPEGSHLLPIINNIPASNIKIQPIQEIKAPRIPLQPLIIASPEGSHLLPIINNIRVSPIQEIKAPRIPLQPLITEAPEGSHLQPIINNIPVSPIQEIKAQRVPLQPLITEAPEGSHLQPLINNIPEQPVTPGPISNPESSDLDTEESMEQMIKLQEEKLIKLQQAYKAMHQKKHKKQQVLSMKPVIIIPVKKISPPAPQPQIVVIHESQSHLDQPLTVSESHIAVVHASAHLDQQPVPIVQTNTIHQVHVTLKPKPQKKIVKSIVPLDSVTNLQKTLINEKLLRYRKLKSSFNKSVVDTKLECINIKPRSENQYESDRQTSQQDELEKTNETEETNDAKENSQEMFPNSGFENLENEKLLRYQKLKASFNKSVIDTKPEYTSINPRKERHDELNKETSELADELKFDNERSQMFSKYDVVNPEEMESRKFVSNSLSKYQKMKNSVDVLSHSMKVKNMEIGSYDYVKEILEKSKKNKEENSVISEGIKINHTPIREIFDTNLDYDKKVYSSIKLVLNNLSAEFKKLDMINERLYKNSDANFLTDDGYIRFTKNNLSLIIRKGIALQDDSDSEMISLSFDDKLNRLYDYSYKNLIAQNKHMKQNNIYFDSTEVDQAGLKKVVDEILKKNDFTGKSIKYSNFNQKSILNLVFNILKDLPIMLLKTSSKAKLNVSNVSNVRSTYEEADYDPFITKKNAKFLKKEEIVMGPKKQEELDKQVKSQPGQGRQAVRKDGKVEKTEIFNTMTWPDSCKTGLQSPININKPYKPEEVKLQINFQPPKGKITYQNDGFKLIFRADSFGSIIHGVHEYDAKYIEVHHPSEHSFGDDEVRSPLELQVICQDIFGNTAAVSISFKIDDQENEFLSTLGFGVDNPLFALNLRNNEVIKFEEKLFSEKLDIGKYVNKTIHYVSYMGSLTSPPCTQNVQWFVLLQKMSVSQTQLEYFPVLFGKDENVRGLQPLDDRKLWII